MRELSDSKFFDDIHELGPVSMLSVLIVWSLGAVSRTRFTKSRAAAQDSASLSFPTVSLRLLSQLISRGLNVPAAVPVPPATGPEPAAEPLPASLLKEPLAVALSGSRIPASSSA